MNQTIYRATSILLLVLSLVGTLAGAQTPGKAASERDEQAMFILKRMADFLSQAQRFSVVSDIGFDVVQESGQKIEFGETRQIVVRRPDQARIDITKRDGGTSGFIFDGKEIAVFNTREHVYATAAKPGTLDEAIDYFMNDLDMRFPLADLLSSKLDETLPTRVRAASYVEPASIAGVPCDHLAFRGDWADLQLWIAQGNQPLPHRLVLTYKKAEGQPQFWAQFSDWNLSPNVPDSLFVFSPPEGAAKIAFASRKPVQAGEKERKGKKGARQ
ncbi:MAG: DUF2092 domain-containing protein [Candidatus Entotheonellia bacterium]